MLGTNDSHRYPGTTSKRFAVPDPGQGRPDCRGKRAWRARRLARAARGSQDDKGSFGRHRPADPCVEPHGASPLASSRARRPERADQSATARCRALGTAVIYFDSSALMKLIRREGETAPLSEWLDGQPDATVVTSELGRVEVLRAARRAGGGVMAEARAVVGDLDLVPLDRGVQDLASEIGDPLLRTLDALHLASAVLLRDELTAFVAYDHRLVSDANAAGLPTMSPGLPDPADAGQPK